MSQRSTKLPQLKQLERRLGVGKTDYEQCRATSINLLLSCRLGRAH